MRKKLIVIHDPIFDTDILVQRAGTLASCIDDYCKRLKITPILLPQSPQLRGKFLAYDDNRACMIWLSDKASLGTVAHEALHATVHIMNKVGISLTNESEEVYTYHQQFLINQIMIHLYKWSAK